MNLIRQKPEFVIVKVVVIFRYIKITVQYISNTIESPDLIGFSPPVLAEEVIFLVASVWVCVSVRPYKPCQAKTGI